MKHNSGQSIVETLIAATIVAIVLVALVTLSVNTQSNSSYARDLNRATAFNDELAEYIRQEKDSISWNAFYDYIKVDDVDGDYEVYYCVADFPSTFQDLSDTGPCSSSSLKIGTIFWREAHFTLGTTVNDPISLTVTTYWPNTNTENHKAVLETKLRRVK